MTLAVDARSTTPADVMAELNMQEGFDVGFEMSGVPVALRDMLASMTTAARSPSSGCLRDEFGIDWAHLVTNMITIKGIYGRQMFETWYWMSVLINSGLDISPVITHRFDADHFEPPSRSSSRASAARSSSPGPTGREVSVRHDPGRCAFRAG